VLRSHQSGAVPVKREGDFKDDLTFWMTFISTISGVISVVVIFV
jgi:hypothetical protein